MYEIPPQMSSVLIYLKQILWCVTTLIRFTWIIDRISLWRWLKDSRFSQVLDLKERWLKISPSENWGTSWTQCQDCHHGAVYQMMWKMIKFLLSWRYQFRPISLQLSDHHCQDLTTSFLHIISGGEPLKLIEVTCFMTQDMQKLSYQLMHFM